MLIASNFNIYEFIVSMISLKHWPWASIFNNLHSTISLGFVRLLGLPFLPLLESLQVEGVLLLPEF